jgi:hypothetical protein
MNPAFRSRRGLIGFLFILLLFLAAPAICGRLRLFSRPAVYAAMPESAGDFSFLKHEIFEENSDLDIVFLGPSVVMHGIDTPYIQKKLSERLGRPARVLTLGSLFEGEERNYVLLRDLLRHRKVKMLFLKVVGDDAWRKFPNFSKMYSEPYPYAHRLLVWGEDSDIADGFSFSQKAGFYAGSLLGTPRHLLSLFRSDITRDQSLGTNLGSIKSLCAQPWDEKAYVAFSPPPPHLPNEMIIRPASAWNSLRYSDHSFGPYPRHFLKKMGDVLRENRVHLVILNLPCWWSEGRTNSVQEVARWPDIIGVPAELLHVPTAPLFAGRSDGEVQKLYADIIHFNKNGSEFFTPVITPAIIDLYLKEIEEPGKRP